ncbi:uncharacterized protein [Miscanthus floridulus]|uniref:uncharacterized protein n=1 Tax=Miscanthus floridulus TaxID=154761 RepID=UPI00345AA5DC
MVEQIAKELMAQQTKFFQDEIKKMQVEMSKMKEELSKKVEDTISGKNEATKDTTSDVAAGEHAHRKGIQEKKKKVKDDSSSEEEDSNADIAFVIRNLRKFMKKKRNCMTYGDRRKRYKKRFCYRCGKTSHIIVDCPKEKKNKYNKDEDKKNKDKKRGEAHLGEEWESNDSDSSDDEKKKKGATNLAIHHSSSPTMIFPDLASPPKLFPNLDSSSRLFSNLIDNEYYTLTYLVAKGRSAQHEHDMQERLYHLEQQAGIESSPLLPFVPPHDPLALHDEACVAYMDDASSRPHGKSKAIATDEDYIEEDDDDDDDDGDDGDHDDEEDYKDE